MKNNTTCYEFVEGNLNLIVVMINNGLLKIDLLKYIEIYERFLSLSGTKGERYKQLAEEYDISLSSVKRHIGKMNKTLKQ